MSGPRHLRRRHSLRSLNRLSRRRFLMAIPAAGSALLAACGGGQTDAPRSLAWESATDVTAMRRIAAAPGAKPAFLHGIATGDPTDQAVIFWTRVTLSGRTSIEVKLEVFSDPQGTNLVATSSQSTDASRDFTVKIDQAGLRPATTYYYRFLADGVSSSMGRTRTAPAADGHPNTEVRFGVVSCSSMPHGFFNAYRFLGQRQDVDAIIHLGDYIYEYANGAYGNVRQAQPAHEIETLEDYRTRHACYKQDTDLMELHRQFPFITIWDDHETTDNAYAEGTTGDSSLPAAGFANRVNAARRAYDEWMPIRLPDPHGEGAKRIHRKLSYGPHVELFMTDSRLYARDAQLSTPIGSGGPNEVNERNNPSREMLGPDQFEFLATGLEDSRATWKLWCNQVVFHQWIVAPALKRAGGPLGLNGDSWDAYNAERQRLIDRVRGDGFNGQGVDNLVILTGDVHSMWAADVTDDPNNPLAYTPGATNIPGDQQRQYSGAVACEFVVQSVTSPGIPAPAQTRTLYDAALRAVTNPHIKHVDLDVRGYAVVTATAKTFNIDYFAIDTVTTRVARQSFIRGFTVREGANRIGGIRNAPLLEGQPRIPVRLPVS